MKTYSNTSMAVRLWCHSFLLLSAGICTWALAGNDGEPAGSFIFLLTLVPVAASIGSLPALFIYILAFPFINRDEHSYTNRWLKLFFLNTVIVTGYTMLALVFVGFGLFYDIINTLRWVFIPLFLCSQLALFLNTRILYNNYFITSVFTIIQTQNHRQMTQDETPVSNAINTIKKSSSPMIKGFITGALILLLLIPTAFIANLVTEREQRQKAVVEDVSSKWAGGQTITGPYIFVPYTVTDKAVDGKVITRKKHFILLPDELDVSGSLETQERQRSIYKVLLYQSALKTTGRFIPALPTGVAADQLLLNEARICVGISDFKGIGQKIDITMNGISYTLSPGLPTDDIDKTGLSAPLLNGLADFQQPLDFKTALHLKGSGQLHFVPLAGNSSFALASAYPNPSFDGNSLPATRSVTEKGFTARWNFNKANLPFSTVLTDAGLPKEQLKFGVNILQTSDQYVKTSKSVKYALLFIGLTFSFFFIIELLQQKPMHPVQYVLVGLALVIFYTLLLSFSEFIAFDLAYIISAAATILLIAVYAASHFKNWKTGVIFAALLSALYGFIFVLIRLEDTALLVGSIGLFLILALAMRASRKINWYAH